MRALLGAGGRAVGARIVVSGWGPGGGQSPRTSHPDVSPLLTYIPYRSKGLVQWVENTVPMADYLAGRNRQGGAHLRWV